jgi:hypothetical protein
MTWPWQNPEAASTYTEPRPKMLRFEPNQRTADSKMVLLLGLTCLALAALTTLDSPIRYLGLAGAVLILAASFFLAIPVPAIFTVAMLVSAVPKAGIKYGSFPFPLFLFILVIVAGFLYASSQHGRPASAPLGFLLGWIFIRVVMITGNSAPLGSVVTVVAWATIPIVFIYLGSARPSGPLVSAWGKGLEIGVVVASLFAMVQNVVGIPATTIPGVTIALGDSYASKNLQLFNTSGDVVASKIPGTYQNGNVLGAALAFFFVAALYRILRQGPSRRDWILFLASGAAIVLSGSRTAIIAAIVPLFWMVLSNPRTRLRGIAVLGGLLIAFQFLVPLLVPQLSSRLQISNLLSSGGAGRTALWRQGLETSSYRDLLLGSSHTWFSASAAPGSGLSEGWFGIVQQIGFLGVALIVAVAWRCTSQPSLRPWRLPLLALAVAATLDTSYLVFPTLFLGAARMLAPWDLSDQATPLDTGERHAEGQAPAQSRPRNGDRGTSTVGVAVAHLNTLSRKA